MKLRTLFKSASILGITLAVTAPSVPSGAATRSIEMVFIPKRKLSLGSTVEDLVFALDECERSRKRRGAEERCSPDEFSDELNTGTAVEVMAFYLDRTEVSQGAYSRCVQAARCPPITVEISTKRLSGMNLPVTSISAFEANEYCRFVNARLPTEAEFESAARGSQRRAYPWGTNFHRRRANAGSEGITRTDDSDGYQLLAPTVSFPSGASPEGALNLAGNVEEWTSSPYLPHASKSQDSVAKRTVKGGSFSTPRHTLRGSARRGVPASRREVTVGFRCALSLIPKRKELRP